MKLGHTERALGWYSHTVVLLSNLLSVTQRMICSSYIDKGSTYRREISPSLALSLDVITALLGLVNTHKYPCSEIQDILQQSKWESRFCQSRLNDQTSLYYITIYFVPWATSFKKETFINSRRALNHRAKIFPLPSLRVLSLWISITSLNMNEKLDYMH